MGIWKSAGKDWNRQDRNSSKKKKKGNSEESMREIRWGRRKWDPTNKYHDYGAKLLIVLIEKLGRLDFELGMGGPEEKKWWEREWDKRRKWENLCLSGFFLFIFLWPLDDLYAKC